MVRLLRRLVLASLLVGGAAFAVRRRRGRLPSSAGDAASSHASTAAWPPIATDEGQPIEQDRATAGRIAADRTRDVRPFVEVASDEVAQAPGDRAWVEPVNGECPDGYPIKANDNSRIFHVPGGRFYDRTVPERCYAEAEAAVADGYRAAKA